MRGGVVIDGKGWIIGIVVAIIGGIWWYNTQSSVVGMSDGVYDCQAVYVNAEGKYQVIESGGQNFDGYLKVSGGEVDSLSAPQDVLGWDENPDLVYTNSGRDHVRVTDNETYTSNHFAFACEHQG